MSHRSDLQVIWGIRCFNTKLKKFMDRDYILDTSKINETELQNINDILISFRRNNIVRYRKYFIPYDRATVDKKKVNFHLFSLPDYCEDEHENPIDEIAIAKMISGNNKIILWGNAKSALALGPSPMINPDDWQQKDSDTLAHLLQVCSQIQKSSWHSSKLSLSGKGSEVTANLPSLESLLFVSIYFRQLCSTTDKLLIAACKIYCRYVENQAKREWVNQQKKAFLNALKDRTLPFPLEGSSNQELFEAFLYGSLILHSVDGVKDPSTRNLCYRLLNNHDKRKVAFCINTFLRRIMGYVSGIAVVIYQDFSHWQNQYSIPKPDIFWHSKLFGDYTTIIEEGE